MLNPERFAKFAHTLALVLSHPKTPANDADFFRRHLLPIAAQLASVPPESITAPRPEAARLNAHALFLDFGLAVADVIDDDDLDDDAYCNLIDCAGEIQELLEPESATVCEASRLRGVVKEFARAQGLFVAP